MKLISRQALAATLLAGLLLAGAAPGADVEVKDGAKLFSAAAVQKANEALKAIQTTQNKDVVIETFASVPSNDADKVKQSGAERDRYFTDWAENRMKQHDVKDIYILICRSPGRFQIEVGPETQEKAFTEKDRNELRELLVADFKKKEFDQGLLNGINFIRKQLQSNQPFTLPRVVARQVSDRAKLFGPEAVQRANAQIQEIYQVYRKGVTIETIETIAPDRVAQVKNMSPDDRNQFFKELLDARVMQAGAGDDIHILICRTPSHLHIDVLKDTEQKAFTRADRDLLRKEMIARLNKKQFDDGLAGAVRFIREKVASHILPAPVANQVTDHAQFFSAAAVQSANARIKRLHESANKNVTIETLPTVEPDQVKPLADMDAEQRNDYFRRLRESRVKASQVDGVYVMICKNPQHIEIAAGPQTRRTFTDEQREKLLAVLKETLGAKKYDPGLNAAIDLLSGTPPKTSVAAVPPAPVAPKPSPAAPQTTAAAPPGKTDTGPSTPESLSDRMDRMRKSAEEFAEKETPPVKWKYVIYVVLGLLGLWIFIGVLRALFGGGRKQNPPPAQAGPGAGMPPQRSAGGNPGGGYPQGGGNRPPAGGGYQAGGYQGGGQPAGGYPPPATGGGGGGFMSGMLGGMFGAAAGSWIYDSFRGHSGGSAATPPVQPTAPRHYGQPQSPAPADSGIASTGGDFGGEQISSTGADFGEDAENRVGSTGADFGNEADTQVGSSGGDFGETGTPDAGGGGDFGDAAENYADNSSGGESGGDSGGGDFGESADTGGGGDFGGGDDSASSGGDSGGSDGGDF